MSLQDAYLVEELKKNNKEDSLRELRVLSIS